MKSILVTGGSAGIGEATAKKFSDQGYQVFNLDMNKPLQPIKNTHTIPCDLSQTASITLAVEAVAKSTDSLEVVVCSAGQFFSGTIEDSSEEDFDRILNVNLKGSFFLLKAVLPLLKKQKSSSVILLGSDQTLIGKPHSAIYGATKAAIGQLAKSTALDYAPYHIRVNAVCPGTIDTPMYRNAILKYHQKSGIPLAEIEAQEASLQPLNRIGQPEEVAELIYFLGSEASSFITGSLIAIDGGYTAR
jgi:2-keto-3-deoxy-L-fuconate dehydrogenase